MAHQDPAHQFKEIQSVIAHYEATFANNPSPQAIYDEKQARLRTQVKEAVASLRAAETDEESATYEDVVIDLSGQMEDLKRHYTEKSAQYAREHELRLREIMDNLRDRLAHILGLQNPTQNQTPISQQACDQPPSDMQQDQDQHQNQNPPNTETHETEAARDESAQESSHASQHVGTGTGTKTTIDESLRKDPPSNEAVVATPEPEDAIDQGPMFRDEEDDHVDNDKTNDDAVNGDENAEVEMADAEQPIEVESAKPRNEFPEKTAVNITTASRNLQTAPLSPVSTCDDITPRRATEQRHRSQWSMNAPPRNILSSTGKETLSKKRKASTPVSTTGKRHRTDPASSAESPQKSRTEQSCQTTAETSRRSTTERSIKPPMPAVAEPSERVLRRSHRHTEESTDNDKFEGILHPKPGNIYTTYWKKTKEWLAVVLLPMGDFSTVGIPGSIVSCDLIETLPSCYNKTPKRGKYVWAKGYRNREAHEKERMFPVMFFDGRPFPGKSAIMWIEARELRDFDPKQKHKLIPHLKTVRGYLKSRDWSEDEEDSDEDSEEVKDDEGEDAGEDKGESAEEERTREGSVWQEDPGCESPQRTDAEEHQETLPTEEPASQVNDNPPQPSNQQKSRPQDQSQSASESSDIPQHQTEHPLQKRFPTSFWSTVSAALPRLPSVAPISRLDHSDSEDENEMTHSQDGTVPSDAPNADRINDQHAHQQDKHEAEQRRKTKDAVVDYIDKWNPDMERHPSSHLPDFQASTSQNTVPRRYSPLPPIQQVVSNLPSQAAHQIINGQLQDTRPQQPGPHQEYGNEFQNGRTTQSSYNSFHLRPLPVETRPQPQYSVPKDTNEAHTTQRFAVMNSGAVMKVVPPQQPQGSAPLPAQNHTSCTVPVPPQQLSCAPPEQAQPRPDAPAARQPSHPIKPQEPRAIPDNLDAGEQLMRLYQNISQPTRTDDEASQGQMQSLSDNQPAPQAVIQYYHTHQMPGSNKYNKQQREWLQKTDARDEELYAQRGHLDPSHTCFHALPGSTGKVSLDSDVLESGYFPNGLGRYLQNYPSMNGLSPVHPITGFYGGRGYRCPFCAAYEKHGGPRSPLCKRWMDSRNDISKVLFN
ncbi:hypothetical protein EDB82DRAFT_474871 [Fusarium venenatum]|uniref:uncharacterized protein n=1 Tax=Fusarium venenatum TaxID=56646 RepID=UPI001D48578C|nr:hypothetical protein EDB82DRAFT_474871 [Fusarium venenatum]